MLNLVFAVVLIAQAAQQPAVPALPVVEVLADEVARHRTSDWLFLRITPEQRAGGAFSGIKVAVTVDVTGAVVSAHASRGQSAPVDYEPAIYAEAESLVRALHYAPFARDGHSVAVRYTEYVSLLPPELKPVVHVPFPKVKDLRSVKITLRRTGCFGTCPSYSVEVNGDGTVLYQGEAHVAFTGTHHGSVSHDNVVKLIKLFEGADYYSLRDNYRLRVTDMSTYFTSIEIDGHVKQVEDYAGLQIGMPFAVSEVEVWIDRLSGSERWIKGSPEKDKD